MNIIHFTESLTAFDGKNILYLKIDKPQVTSKTSEYLLKYSEACYCFSRNSLFNYLLNQYISQYETSRKGFVYSYIFAIKETYLLNKIASYLLISSLFSKDTIVAQGTDSVIFFKDHIVDPKMICGRINKNKASVFINEKGVPSIAYTKDFRLFTEPIKKYKFPI